MPCLLPANLVNMSPSVAPDPKPASGTVPTAAVLANGHCVKARLTMERLDELGIRYVKFDVDADDTAQAAFGALFSDGIVKAPALVIGSRLFRNPRTDDLEKLAIRHGLIERRMLHDEANGRYFWPMLPGDAFASYVMRDGRRIVGHIEVDKSLRGTGLGARLARELLTHLEQDFVATRLTCSFLRKVARSDRSWAERFL